MTTQEILRRVKTPTLEKMHVKPGAASSHFVLGCPRKQPAQREVALLYPAVLKAKAPWETKL